MTSNKQIALALQKKAEKEVARLKAKGWTRKDFARALSELLSDKIDK